MNLVPYLPTVASKTDSAVNSISAVISKVCQRNLNNLIMMTWKLLNKTDPRKAFSICRKFFSGASQQNLKTPVYYTILTINLGMCIFFSLPYLFLSLFCKKRSGIGVKRQKCNTS